MVFILFSVNWRIIALQCCVGFCYTSTRISHRYTYVPLPLEHPSHFPPPSHPFRLSQSPDMESRKMVLMNILLSFFLFYIPLTYMAGWCRTSLPRHWSSLLQRARTVILPLPLSRMSPHDSIPFSHLPKPTCTPSFRLTLPFKTFFFLLSSYTNTHILKLTGLMSCHLKYLLSVF